MRILAIAASMREGSSNRKLLKLAIEELEGREVEVEHIHFKELDMPMYNGDDETESGLPASCLWLNERIEAADALMIATPEYNFSMPGTLKNVIDWVSRARPMPLKGQVGYLLSASNSMIGGMRGLWHLRQPLEGLGVLLMPFMYSLPQASAAFSDDGRLVDDKRAETLALQVEQFIETTKKLRAE